MIILSIGTDARVFDENSDVRQRLIAHASLFEEFHVVVMSGHIKDGAKKEVLNNNLILIPFSSRTKVLIFLKGLFGSYFYAKKLKKKGKDLYITSQDLFEVGLISFIISKFLKIKLQLQFHTDCFNALFIKHNLANYFRTIIARVIVSRASSIRVVSERIKNSLLTMDSKLSARIHVLPVWTDISVIKNKQVVEEFNLRTKFPEFSKIILIVARLESEKNIDLSIRAFQKALRFDKNIGLVIAGSGSKESWLKELVRYLNIENNVKFLGWVNETASLYKTADLLLVTSWYEGYGLNMVESVACGTPVAATDVGVARELGAIIVSYDAGLIALNLIEVLKQNNKVDLPQKFIIIKSEYLSRFKNTFI